MKNFLLAMSLLAVASTAAAGNRAKCCSQGNRCQSTGCTQTTRWYKAKDGTYREMMPYAEALSRAEDADDMEITLRGVREELTASVLNAEAAKAETAAVRAELEAQIAELRQQLDAGKQDLAAQTERADKAEAAHKLSVETIAQLRDEARRSEEALTGVRNEVKTLTGERDGLKTAASEMEKQISDLTAARDASEEARRKAEEELARMKQEAAETKKAEVQEEKKEDDAAPPEDGKKDGEGAAPGAPGNPPAN